MLDLVVVGLGYVGLPLAREAVASGLKVVGLDSSSDVVDLLNEGQSHVDDLPSEVIQEMIESGFSATTDPSCCNEARTIVICVPTPLSKDGGPDLAYVENACRDIGAHLTRDALVVLESTTYPGTTAEVVGPLLAQHSAMEVNKDFWVAYSPERIDPGNDQFGLRNTPKVVGADDTRALQVATDFYSKVVDSVVSANGTREAESAKLLENTYRHVNIALVNEMAKFFHEMNIDIWDVIRLASTKPFGFQKFTPGPGVGGHCIPIDPNYLSHRVRQQLGYAFRFVELAQEINNSMPAYVAQRCMEILNGAGRALNGSRVGLLGVTYKPDISDQRESPAQAVAQNLMRLGAEVVYHDPYVGHWEVTDSSSMALPEVLGSADLVVLLQPHSTFDLKRIAADSALLLDTRGVTDRGGVRL